MKMVNGFHVRVSPKKKNQQHEKLHFILKLCKYFMKMSRMSESSMYQDSFGIPF